MENYEEMEEARGEGNSQNDSTVLTPPQTPDGSGILLEVLNDSDSFNTSNNTLPLLRRSPRLEERRSMSSDVSNISSNSSSSSRGANRDSMSSRSSPLSTYTRSDISSTSGSSFTSQESRRSVRISNRSSTSSGSTSSRASITRNFSGTSSRSNRSISRCRDIVKKSKHFEGHSIPKATFSRLVNQITREMTHENVKFGNRAKDALQTVTEKMLVDVFKVNAMVMDQFDMKTLLPKAWFATRAATNGYANVPTL